MKSATQIGGMQRWRSSWRLSSCEALYLPLLTPIQGLAINFMTSFRHVKAFIIYFGGCVLAIFYGLDCTGIGSVLTKGGGPLSVRGTWAFLKGMTIGPVPVSGITPSAFFSNGMGHSIKSKRTYVSWKRHKEGITLTGKGSIVHFSKIKTAFV